ncbi:hypothetical protein D3C85_1927020 [compost metagenome]
MGAASLNVAWPRELPVCRVGFLAVGSAGEMSLWEQARLLPQVLEGAADSGGRLIQIQPYAKLA